jgi:hypothetical protein
MQGFCRGDYFVDVNGEKLAQIPMLLPIPLCKGLHITIHSSNKVFSVVEWKFHIDHPDENAGLTIVVQ